ncbi:hypothetical protein [Peribacillus sp. FSL E2-0218]|uniref:hypothetical protein n=1 Tax=Peribacillus sp. FSL E2-0218 TaxID=2921364 RepID=UPI0030EF082B
MKFYKHILVPFLVGLLSFVCFSIYSYTIKGTAFFTEESLFTAIGVFIGAIPVSYLIEYQKKKDKNKFNS